jgi:MoaA/NifB/PqqE/SkfB family radical SAM enzyme
MFKPIEEIQEFFKDKRVLIVGNSVEIMTGQYADLIDSFDVVIRLGRGIKTTPEDEIAVGKKVDVWISGLFRIGLLQEPEIQEKLKNKLILLNGSRIDVTDGWLEKTIKEYEYTPIFSDEEILQFYEKYGIINNSKKSFRFSGGMWTIFFLLEKIKTQKSLDIIGFDFFKSLVDYPVNDNSLMPSSWHTPSVGSEVMVHNGSFEETLVKKYIEEEKLNWIKINNSDKKRIYTMVKFGSIAKKLQKKKEKDQEIIQNIRVINLNLTNACNLRCTFCPIGSDDYVNDYASMTVDTVKKFIERSREFVESRKSKVTVSLSGKGEATVHKDFEEIVLLLAENRDVLNLQILTNGALLYKYRHLIPLFSRIVYDSYKDDNNKNKSELLEIIKNSPNATIREIDNTKQWFEITDFTNRVGVLNGPTESVIKYNYCHKLFQKMMIECDGSYLICCDDWKKNKLFGTIYDRSFTNYLLSPELRKYRRHILKGVRQMDPCRTCTFSSKPIKPIKKKL